MRRRIFSLTLALLACAPSGLLSGQAAAPNQPELSDEAIRALLVRASQAAYSGACPCPESRNRNGNRCGGNSAYSRPGGERPLCYSSDVSDAMVKQYRERQR